MSFFKRLFGQKEDNKLSEIINDGAFIVDVRTPAEYSAGSVKSAVNIPLNTLSQEISKFKNKKNIVVFCQSGGRSGQAKSILEKNGIQNVVNGINAKTVKQAIHKK